MFWGAKILEPIFNNCFQSNRKSRIQLHRLLGSMPRSLSLLSSLEGTMVLNAEQSMNIILPLAFCGSAVAMASSVDLLFRIGEGPEQAAALCRSVPYSEHLKAFAHFGGDNRAPVVLAFHLALFWYWDDD